jgi:hypothetical protein
MDEKVTPKIGQGLAGPGRPKGKSNRTTIALKDAILKAAAEHGADGAGAGGLQGYLLKVAREDIKAFAGLLGRVLPLTVTGDPNSPVQIEFRTVYETK